MAKRSDWLRGGIAAILLAEAVAGAVTGRWSLVFIALSALGLSLLPVLFARWVGLRLPRSFLAAIAVFVFATMYLGEALDFYERLWWWDLALHFGSALGFGVVGFLFVFIQFEGDRYAAPPWAIAFLSMTIAISIGVTWEIFEFAMDQIFGLTMQKSGLVDTMYDLIVDVVGAFIGAAAGYLYLKGRQFGGIGVSIDQFVTLNRDWFRKFSKFIDPRKGK